MALVTEIKPIHKENQKVHGETSCSYSIVSDGKSRFLQLDTYGSATRKLTGKTSQSIQLDRAAAAQLKALIEQTFPGL